MTGLMRGKSLLDSMTLHQGSPTQIHLISLNDPSRPVQSFSTEFFLMGHVINAWQPNNTTVVMDISAFTQGYWTTLFDLSTLRNATARDTQPTGSQIREYTFDLA